MRLLAVIVLLFGLAKSRSVQVDLMSLVKDVALNAGDAETNDATLVNTADGEADEFVNGQDSKVGFILFGKLGDLEKYQIKLNYNVENVKVNSGIKVKLVNLAKENIKDLVDNSEIFEDTDDKDGNKESGGGQPEAVKNKNRDKFAFKLLEDYNEDEDTNEYENSGEREGKGNKVDNISEDEYNDYDERDESAEEVSSEVDESKEDRFYDEDEKYYEDEENQFENNEDDSPFDGIFIEYN